MPSAALKAYLDALVRRYETDAFIASDPISFPHAFDDPRDREVIGLFAALLAWGRRSTLLNKLAELCERMAFRPYAFVMGFDPERDARALAGFKHRTFQPDDALWLVRSLQAVLQRYGTLEELFAAHLPPDTPHIGPAIRGFSETLLTIVPGTPVRLRKHLARPDTGSACKRLSLYARWMVRPGPVDLGLWTRIRPSQLVLPLDVHVGRQARALGLLTWRQNDWRAVVELTEACRRLCPDDPVRYDFAFFGPGASGEPLDARFVVCPEALTPA
ncbi:MAG: TIGR02757 family protein [Bacteroidetes bacterium]|nr:MAG: TIGR02757 family protein [Bacteroidota bacterium]